MNTKSVATLTFHEAVNYGAVLQAYALQKAIKQLGYRTEVLNYSCQAIRDPYYKMPTALKARVGWLLRSRVRSIRQAAFKEFISSFLDIGQVVKRADLECACEKYSTIVVGSDQVWNPTLTNGDTTYFLDFVTPEKKVAYAASIGINSWPVELEATYAHLLSSYRGLSVREKTASEYLSNLIGFEPEVVCDPVFLLSASDWRIIAKAPQIKQKYVLLFAFSDPGKDCLAWVKSIANGLGYKVVVIHFGAMPIPGVINIRDAGPREFLGWIDGAELVISPSFHVSCFSIIFQKNFGWFISDHDSEGVRSRTSRITDLIDTLGISDRVIKHTSTFPPLINYDEVEERLAKYKTRSFSILEGMVQ